jgi:hypothetical protein
MRERSLRILGTVMGTAAVVLTCTVAIAFGDPPTPPSQAIPSPVPEGVYTKKGLDPVANLEAGLGPKYGCYIAAYEPDVYSSSVESFAKNYCQGSIRQQDMSACLEKQIDTGWKSLDCGANHRDSAGSMTVFLFYSDCRTGHYRTEAFGAVQGPSGKWLYQSDTSAVVVLRC